jgi:hypothetical protein
MNCSRCAAELPESATFCSRCGATTASGSLTSSVFSYLPAGAPPWPATVPAKPVYAPGNVATAPSAAVAPVSKPKRSAGSVVRTVALIVLAPLVGIGITLSILASQGLFPPSSANARPGNAVIPKQQQATAVAATPTAAPQGSLPTPTSFKTTNSKDVNISVQYPNDWIAETPQKSSSFTSLIIHTPQQQQTGIEFFVARYTDTTSASITSPDEINQANVTGIGQQQTDTNVQIVSSGQPTIGGTKWVQEDATYVDSTSNTKIHFVTISAQHNKIYYNIAFLVPDMYYSEAMQKYLQHMLDSFQFLS